MNTKTVWTIVLSNVEAMICGVWRIERTHDLVVLTYTDGSREAGTVRAQQWAKIYDNPFAIVSEVQSQRKANT